jgi:hypothetical protein
MIHIINKSSLSDSFINAVVDHCKPASVDKAIFFIKDRQKMRAKAFHYLRIVEIELPQAFPYLRDRTSKPQYIQGLTFLNKQELFVFLAGHELYHLDDRTHTEAECDVYGLAKMRQFEFLEYV